MPKVSVWLTSYNHGKLLRESIDSVINQKYQDYELIIVDDCSTDNSQDIIREYEEKYPKIRTIIHEKNIGNSGFDSEYKNLNGEYVAILHGDDKWQKDKLEKQVEILDNYDNVTACFTGVKIIDFEGKEYVGSSAYSQIFKIENRTRFEWLRYFFYNGNCLCHPSLLIRKEAFEKFDLRMSGLINSLPDFEKWIKLCFHADIYIIPEELTLFRVYANEINQSGDTEQKQNRLFLEEYFVYQKYFCINDLQTMIKIFPQSKEYIKNGEIVIEFALARIFIEGPRNSQKLLGLNMMYTLLQDEASKRKIQELYNYGEKEFNIEKQKYDVFGNIPRENFLMTTLYADTGSGYNEDECIKKRVYIPNTGLVQITYDIQKKFGDRDIKRIRFDLDEGIYRKCAVIRIRWGENGGNTRIKPINGVRQGEEDYFYTLDPQYRIEKIKSGKLILDLKVEAISLMEVEKHHEYIEKEMKILEEYRSSKIIRIWHRVLKRCKRI